jgi:large subunit ribosomal protein L7/L12
MADLKEFAEQLVNLSVKEVNELATILKDEYGIEPAAAAAPMMMAGGGEGGGGAEEQTAFDVVLKSPGSAKLKVVKALKDILGLGLKEAKEMADSAPTNVKEGVEKAEADDLKKQLEEVGAEVEVK